MLDSSIKSHACFNFWNERRVSVVMMQLGQTEHAPAQFEVAKKRVQVRADGGDQSAVNGNWDVVREESGFQGRRIMPGACSKDVRFDRVSQRRGKRVLVVLEFRVELLKGASA